MSVRLMSMVFDLDPEKYKSTSKIVLLALADHANDDGRSIYPSVGRLAHKCGLTERAVQLQLHELRDQNLIRLLGPLGPHATNEYEINVSTLKAGGEP